MWNNWNFLNAVRSAKKQSWLKSTAVIWNETFYNFKWLQPSDALGCLAFLLLWDACYCANTNGRDRNVPVGTNSEATANDLRKSYDLWWRCEDYLASQNCWSLRHRRAAYRHHSLSLITNDEWWMKNHISSCSAVQYQLTLWLPITFKHFPITLNQDNEIVLCNPKSSHCHSGHYISAACCFVCSSDWLCHLLLPLPPQPPSYHLTWGGHVSFSVWYVFYSSIICVCWGLFCRDLLGGWHRSVLYAHSAKSNSTK